MESKHTPRKKGLCARLVVNAQETHDALKALVDACKAVRPLSGDVATETVTDMRRAMAWMEAYDRAVRAISKVEGRR